MIIYPTANSSGVAPGSEARAWVLAVIRCGRNIRGKNGTTRRHWILHKRDITAAPKEDLPARICLLQINMKVIPKAGTFMPMLETTLALTLTQQEERLVTIGRKIIARLVVKVIRG